MPSCLWVMRKGHRCMCDMHGTGYMQDMARGHRTPASGSISPVAVMSPPPPGPLHMASKRGDSVWPSFF